MAEHQAADLWVASRFGSSVVRLRGQVRQGQLSLPSFRGRCMSKGEPLGLTKVLKLASYLSMPGGGATTVEIMVTIVTAILKKQCLSQEGEGHKAATKLLQH